jgi:hypothetical protein
MDDVKQKREERKLLKHARTQRRAEARKFTEQRCCARAASRSGEDSAPTLRVVVAGAGGWYASTVHLPAWGTIERKRTHGFRVVVTGVVTSQETAHQRAQGTIGHELLHFRSVGEAVRSGQCDVVDLVTPSPVIGASIVEALAANVSVISEKPAGVTLQVGQALLFKNGEGDVTHRRTRMRLTRFARGTRTRPPTGSCPNSGASSRRFNGSGGSSTKSRPSGTL